MDKKINEAQIMQKTKGQANPKVVSEILDKILS